MCKVGDSLTPEQAKILVRMGLVDSSHTCAQKLLEMPMSEFSMKLKCVWDKSTQKFERLIPAAAST